MVSLQPFSLVFDSTMVLIHVSGRWGLLENKRSSGYMVVVVVMGEVVGGVVGEVVSGDKLCRCDRCREEGEGVFWAYECFEIREGGVGFPVC